MNRAAWLLDFQYSLYGRGIKPHQHREKDVLENKSRFMICRRQLICKSFKRGNMSGGVKINGRPIASRVKVKEITVKKKKPFYHT